MKTFFIIFTSVVLSLSLMAGGVYYAFTSVPWSALTVNQPLGNVSLTSLNSTDTMSDFPTLYNANNLILNNGKIDTSSSSIAAITTLLNLTSVGTLTTGTWNATAISVSKGGTGTTTPSQYLTILGNGSLGLTHASSTGTTGQVFTSNGANKYPSWQSAVFDTTANYNWTGTNRFTTFHASSTLTINGAAMSWPAYQGIASSTLTADGSGNLNWGMSSRLIYQTSVDVSASNTTASTTVLSTTIPANWLGTNNVVRFKLNFLTSLRTYTTPFRLFVEVLYGSQSNTYTITNAADWSGRGYIEGTLMASGTAAQEESFMFSGVEQGGSYVARTFTGVAATTVDSTAAQTLIVKLRFAAAAASDAFTVDNSYVELVGY